MKAIILAAGVGSRLGAAGGGKPKCLLRLGERTLLRRHLDCLHSHGVDEVTIVTGHGHDEVESEIAAFGATNTVRTAYNPDYRLGSTVSLGCAGSVLKSGADVMLMDADVLYDCGLISRLLASPHANCFLLDREFEPGDEPVKLCVRGGVIVEFSKDVPRGLRFDVQGESVGFFRFSAAMAAEIAMRTEDYIESGRTSAPYEDIIRELVRERPADFGFEDITGSAWIEIDFPGDIARAEQNILAQIEGAAA